MDSQRINKFVATLRGRHTSADAGSNSVASASQSPPGVYLEKGTDGDTSAALAPRAGVFDPQLLSKLGNLELIAKTVVDGFLSGKHRSTHKGGCTDFAEYRPYSRGDDLRLLDWRHYARSDRYYVKRYEDETNLQALFIVDASGSMSFGLSTVSKWRYAQMAAACLAHLLLRQRDSVGLALAADRLIDFVRPEPRAARLSRMLDMLSTMQPGGPSALPEVLTELSSRIRRRGMVVLLSDCFGDVAALKRALEQYRFRGHDVLVVQILAPEELTFPFRRDAFFQDLELHRRLQVNPNVVRRLYLQEFQAFMDQLRTAMTDIDVDLMTCTAGEDLGDVLSHQLRRRAALNNRQRATARA